MSPFSLETPTAAELYWRQGDLGRAVAIYRQVVLQDPHNQEAQKRLRELETTLDGEGKSMGFREQLENIVHGVPGTIACTLMDQDGIVVDSYQVGGTLDVATLLTELAVATGTLRNLAKEELGTGAVREFAIQGTQLSAILRPITEEYFLAVVMTPQAMDGKLRYLMRLSEAEFKKELI